LVATSGVVQHFGRNRIVKTAIYPAK